MPQFMDKPTEPTTLLRLVLSYAICEHPMFWHR